MVFGRIRLMPRTFAYLRVSTPGQTTDNQLTEIQAAGFTIEPRRLVTETVSGSIAASQRRGFARLLDRLEAGDVLVAPFEVPDSAIAAAFAAARSRGVFTILNPAPARVCLPSILDQTDLLVVNETELSFYSGATVVDVEDRGGVMRLVGELARRHDTDVVATLGGAGLVASLAGRSCDLPAREVEVVDTTAAGDTFVGAMAARIASGNSLEASLRFATDAAAICVSRSGAAPSIPTLAEVSAIAEID